MYVHRPTLPIQLSHLMKLEEYMKPTNYHHLSYRVIYHHLLISARSPLIPRDRCLTITLDNTVHNLTYKGPDAQLTTQHNIRLFLNPYKGHPNFNTCLNVGITTEARNPRSDLPSTLVYPVVTSLRRDQNDNVWCAPRTSHLTWVEWSPFPRNQHSTKWPYWHW